jgi:DNA-directed RNA polymerase beta subunit
MDLKLEQRTGLAALTLAHTPMSNHVTSYNHFLQNLLLPLVADGWSHLTTHIGAIHVQYSVSQIQIVGHYAEDLDHTARTNQSAMIHVMATTQVDIRYHDQLVHTMRQPQTRLFSLPHLIGALNSPSLFPMIQQGLFLVRGKSRVLMGHHRKAHNRLTYEWKNGIPQVEFRAEHPAHRQVSTNTIVVQYITQKAKTRERMFPLRVHISWLRKSVPLDLFLGAMGVAFVDFYGFIRWLLPADLLEQWSGMWTLLEHRMQMHVDQETCLDLYAQQCMKEGTTWDHVKRVDMARHNVERVFCVHLDAQAGTHERMCHLAWMVTELMLFLSDRIDVPKVDALRHMEVDEAGMVMSYVLRQRIRACVSDKVKHIRKHLLRFQHQPWTAIFHTNLSLPHVFFDTLTKKIIQFVNTGSISEKRTGITQLLISVNHTSVQTHKRKTASNLKGKEGLHLEARELEKERFGFTCLLDTPDGPDIGLSYERALWSRITSEVEVTHFHFNVLYHLGDLFTALPTVAPLVCEPTLLIGSDGQWMGTIRDVDAALRVLRQAKRHHHLYPLASIWRDRNRLHVSCRAGRFVYPVIVRREWETLHALERQALTGHSALQWFTTWWQRGIIEYMDGNEVHNCAQSIAPQLQASNRWHTILSNYEYLQIADVVAYGMCASSIPFLNHNPSPRGLYQCQMLRQAVNIPPPLEAIKHYQLCYVERPLVSTWSAQQLTLDLTQPGTNFLVAIMPMSFAVEDATMLNANSLLSGILTANVHRIYQAERGPSKHRTRPRFARPDSTSTVTLRHADYDSYMDERGLPRVGTLLQHGDPVIGSVMTHMLKSKHAEEYTQTADSDPSLLVPKSASTNKKSTCVYQDRDVSQVLTDPSGVITDVCLEEMVTKVQTQYTLNPEKADKMSKRCGQKGVIGVISAPHLLPFSQDTGYTVDAVLCIEGLPTRMTGGYLQELLCGKAAALSHNTFQDSQDFRQTTRADTMVEVMNQLKAWGFQPQGTETMIHPVTGDPLPSPVMVGYIHEQRLHHFVSNKAHARATGPLHHLTRQSVHGRKKGGGQRNGYMENYAAVTHGGSQYILERTMLQSDPHVSYAMCKQCGHAAIYNSQQNKRWCQHCQTSQDVTPTVVPYSLTVLQHLLTADGIHIQRFREPVPVSSTSIPFCSAST